MKFIKNITSWNSMRSREARLAWILILPTFLIVFGLVAFPAFFSVWISFRDVGLSNLNDVFNAPFIGFENYQKVFNDFAFKYNGINNWGAAVTSVVYSFSATALTVLIGLVAALLLNRPIKGRGLIRAIFLFPYVAPIVSVVFVWRWLLDPRPSGVLNYLLMTIGAIDEPMLFLSSRGLALGIVILFEAWRYFPFVMLMLLARLQAINVTLYEAAKVDGASPFQKFWYVTLPELHYVLGATFLLRLLWTFNKFDDIFLLTGGSFGTNVLPVLTYQFSFKMFDFGRGAATAMILLIMLIVFMSFYLRFVMKNVDD